MADKGQNGVKKYFEENGIFKGGEADYSRFRSDRQGTSETVGQPTWLTANSMVLVAFY